MFDFLTLAIELPFLFLFSNYCRYSTWLHDFHFSFNLIIASWIIQYKLNCMIQCLKMWSLFAQGSQNYWLVWIVTLGSKVLNNPYCDENKTATIICLPLAIALEMPAAIPFWRKLNIIHYFVYFMKKTWSIPLAVNMWGNFSLAWHIECNRKNYHVWLAFVQKEKLFDLISNFCNCPVVRGFTYNHNLNLQIMCFYHITVFPCNCHWRWIVFF